MRKIKQTNKKLHKDNKTKTKGKMSKTEQIAKQIKRIKAYEQTKIKQKDKKISKA